jgi:hypothetical protein
LAMSYTLTTGAREWARTAAPPRSHEQVARRTMPAVQADL